MPGCEHDWQPVRKWSGRYRCRECHAYGYRKAVVDSKSKRPGEIIPYKCSGFKCQSPAQIISHRKDIQLCFNCYRKKKAKEAEHKAKQDVAWQALQEKAQKG